MWTERQAIEVFHLLVPAQLRRAGRQDFVRAQGRLQSALLPSQHPLLRRHGPRYPHDGAWHAALECRCSARRGCLSPLAASPGNRDCRQSRRRNRRATTQRWKIALRIGDQRATIPTKIEFSRRALDCGAAISPVEPELIRRYRLYPVTRAALRTAGSPSRRRSSALALRTETQARDIFDSICCSTLAPHRPLPKAPAGAAACGHRECDDDRLRRLRSARSSRTWSRSIRRIFAARASWDSLQEQVSTRCGRCSHEPDRSTATPAEPRRAGVRDPRRQQHCWR